jgi:hypothetical protein
MIGLMNSKNRPLSDDLELTVRHDRGDFNDRIPLGIKPGHFQIDPD